jgi:hypothetical protein
MIHMALTADEEIRRLRRLAETPHLGNESRSWPLATGVTGARNGMSQIADFELTTGWRSLIGPPRRHLGGALVRLGERLREVKTASATSGRLPGGAAMSPD